MINENNEIAPEDNGEGESLPQSKGRRTFSRLRRELSDEELSSPAVQRLLLDEIDRLEKDNSILSEYQNSYHQADKKVAILSEKLNANIATEIIFGVCLTVGAAIIGLAPTLWSSQKSFGVISISIGVVLILGGIASKVVKR